MTEESPVVSPPVAESGSKQSQFGFIYSGLFKDKNPDVRAVSYSMYDLKTRTARLLLV